MPRRRDVSSTFECVILVGLPGAGKTTLYRDRFARTHEVLSLDLYPAGRRSAARLEADLRRALAAGRSVVVDNTNATAAVRAPLIRTARAHGAAVIGYYVEATTREAVARNMKRQGRDRVPNVAIFATAGRLQPPVPDEGFDRLYRARMRPDGAFDIAPLERA